MNVYIHVESINWALPIVFDFDPDTGLEFLYVKMGNAISLSLYKQVNQHKRSKEKGERNIKRFLSCIKFSFT